MAHEVRGQLGSEFAAVLIAPKEFRRGAVLSDTDDAEIGFGIALHVFEIFASARDDENLTDERRGVEARRNGAENFREVEIFRHFLFVEQIADIAAVPFVREALVEQQQKMGEDKGIVMDGRDIGTTVFPNAELKIFVTASSQVRAQRRFDELKEKGMPADFDAILKNVEERDYIDTHRETSPLRKADDAITLDNSNMTIPEQKAWLMEQYQKAIAE